MTPQQKAMLKATAIMLEPYVRDLNNRISDTRERRNCCRECDVPRYDARILLLEDSKQEVEDLQDILRGKA